MERVVRSGAELREILPPTCFEAWDWTSSILSSLASGAAACST